MVNWFRKRALVHPFGNRVEGLELGLYVLLRDISQKDLIRAAMLNDFAWERPPKTPENLDFYLLAQGDGCLAIKGAFCRPGYRIGRMLCSCFDGCRVRVEELLRKYGP